MNIESTGLIDVMGQGPMCPQGLPPIVHPLHQAARRTQDVAYGAAETDGDGEFTSPEAEKVYYAITYGPQTGDHMRLFRDSVQAISGFSGAVAVEALYFRCQICGFVLPASRKPGL